MSKREFSFVQLDVFTSHPLEGNQLAVFTDARGLTDDEMQKLARETNLCETTFILPRDAETERREGRKVRIFTVYRGAALRRTSHSWDGMVSAPALRARMRSCSILKVGKIPVRFESAMACSSARCARPSPSSEKCTRTTKSPRFSVSRSPSWTRACPSKLFRPACAFTMVPFRSLPTLQKLSVGWNQMAPYLATVASPAFFYLSAARRSLPRRRCTRESFFTTAKIRRQARPRDAARHGQ